MTAFPIAHGMILAAVLFALGLIGIIVRRNVIFLMLCVEIMLNATGLAFVLAAARWNQPDGQVMYVFIVTMAAAEVSVGLALIMRMYHRFKTLDSDATGKMKG